MLVPGEPTAAMSGPRPTLSRSAISESITLEIKRHKIGAALSLLAVLLIAGAAAFGINIWSQPVEGGEPKQITHFNDMLITGFSWTRDGKKLACTRGTLLRDAILITDLK